MVVDGRGSGIRHVRDATSQGGTVCRRAVVTVHAGSSYFAVGIVVVPLGGGWGPVNGALDGTVIGTATRGTTKPVATRNGRIVETEDKTAQCIALCDHAALDAHPQQMAPSITAKPFIRSRPECAHGAVGRWRTPNTPKPAVPRSPESLCFARIFPVLYISTPKRRSP